MIGENTNTGSRNSQPFELIELIEHLESFFLVSRKARLGARTQRVIVVRDLFSHFDDW
jgi:hypothetical protein